VTITTGPHSQRQHYHRPLETAELVKQNVAEKLRLVERGFSLLNRLSKDPSSIPLSYRSVRATFAGTPLHSRRSFEPGDNRANPRFQGQFGSVRILNSFPLLNASILVIGTACFLLFNVSSRLQRLDSAKCFSTSCLWG
jgi:hypothetical protein